MTVALLTALGATALLMGLGVSLLLVGTGEGVLAAHHRDATAAAYAARAAAAVGVAELRALPSWSGVVAAGAYPDVSSMPARLVDSTLLPVSPWGATLDLRALTARVQAETDAGGSPGDPVTWRLFAYAPLARLAPAAAQRNPLYLLVWVADDAADGDGNPAADTNGILVVHVEAAGPDDLRSIVELSVQRHPVAGGPDLFRTLATRPAP
jgi:hypothetical protein